MTEENASASFTILIVDDEPKNIQLLGSLLKDHQYHVEFAMGGEQALGWLKKRPFDLVLLDIMMPGMDGYEVCKQLKSDKRLQHVPVIFLTAKTEDEDIAQCFDVGGADYVAKPFKTMELLARIKVQVEMKTLRGLIPVCASCKDVRDDKGVWSRIEKYIEKNSSALFSHSVCPKCAEKIYGDQNWYKKMSSKDKI